MSSSQRGRPELHWGIVGLGNIANDFVLAMAHCQHPHKVVAVSTSNSVERAQQFKQTVRLGADVKEYGNYEELMRDPNIDVVYISAMNNMHYPLVVMALENGKSVLCEKPLVYSGEEVEAIQKVHRVCNSQKEGKKLFLMEGHWSRFFPSWQRAREIVRSGEMGEPRVVFATFCSLLPENRRDLSQGECPFMDIGCYTIDFASFIFDGKKVVEVKAIGELDEEGVDKWSSVIIRFEGGGHAVCYSTPMVMADSLASIVMDKGQVQFPDRFWCPTELRSQTEVPMGRSIEWKTEKFPFPSKRHSEEEQFMFHNSCGLCYEADHVWECIEQGQSESKVLGLDESKKIAQILDEVRVQLGVKFSRCEKDQPDLSKYEKC